jgi:hypothetical protein
MCWTPLYETNTNNINKTWRWRRTEHNFLCRNHNGKCHDGMFHHWYIAKYTIWLVDMAFIVGNPPVQICNFHPFISSNHFDFQGIPFLYENSVCDLFCCKTVCRAIPPKSHLVSVKSTIPPISTKSTITSHLKPSNTPKKYYHMALEI